MVTRKMLLVVALAMVGAGCSGDNDKKSGEPADIIDSTLQDAVDSAQQDVVMDMVPPDSAADSVDTMMDSAGDMLLDTGADQAGDAADTLDVEDQEDETWEGPLPFKVERPDEGEPLTPEEVTAFTKRLTGFYKKTGFFDWLYRTSHGLHQSYDPEMPDYMLFWQDTRAFKEGDRIRFDHFGGADNLALRTAKLLENAAAGYLMSGDPMFARLIVGYSKGFAALALGMDWSSEEPPINYIQARAIFTHDHEYETDGGRKIRVEYGSVKQEKYDWNAHTVPNPLNPHYGEIWVRNMRSKDDVPHMYRMVPVLRQVAQEGADPEVRAAAALAIEYMEGFAKDIVDSGYQIRTKENGETYVPLKEDGTVNDLASFVLYEKLIPNAECNAKYSSALLGYGEGLTNECGEADHNMYEDIAVGGHYFNLHIIRYFHLAALVNALVVGENDKAKELMTGLVKRTERYHADTKGPTEHNEWYPDLAAWLLAAGTSGMPLTSKEARMIMEEYTKSCDGFEQFPHWDPWAETTPEGQFNYVPSETVPVDPENPEAGTMKLIRLQEMVYALEYCQSPWRHPHSAPIFDCEIIGDPSKWGEE